MNNFEKVALNPRDYDNETIAAHIVAVLDKYDEVDGMGPWINEDNLSVKVAHRIVGPFKWGPGIPFDNKVKRVVRILADRGDVIRIGQTARPGKRGGSKTVKVPLRSGRERASYYNSPVVMRGGQKYVQLIADHEANRDRLAREARGRDELFELLGSRLLDGGYIIDSAEFRTVPNESGDVVLPARALDRILIDLAVAKEQ